MTITVYTSPTCSSCVVAKNFLRENQLNFEEVDISENVFKAQQMIERTGSLSLPTTVVKHSKGEEIINGFSPSSFEKIKNYA